MEPRIESANPAPQFILLETTRRCNLRCIHCAVSEENNLGNYKWEDMPLEVFRGLLPILRKYKPRVQLSGHGETFLHPNFMEMLEEVSKAGCEVVFQTNGTILTARSVEQIVRAGVLSVSISIDAATPELFDKIRRRARLEKIIENIRLINEKKKELRTTRPQLVFEFVAMRQNIHELPAVVALAGELGASSLQVAELVEYNLTRGQSLVCDPVMAEWAGKAEAEARKWGVNLLLPANVPGRQVSGPTTGIRIVDPSDPVTYKGLRKTCREPWEKMFVNFDGTVRPCCVISESYGDLSVQSFDEVWSGPKYQALRASLLADEPFGVCAQCPFYGWEPIPSAQPGVSPATAFSLPAIARSKPIPALRQLWRRFVRALMTSPGCTVHLSTKQLLWLFHRLSSSDPRGDVDQVLSGVRTLPESCLLLLENGERLSDSAFVGRAYRKLLGREPDEEGFQEYLNALAKEPISRLAVVSLLLSSAEFERSLTPPNQQ